MNHASPPLRRLAARLISDEAKSKNVSGKSAPVAFVVCERLRPLLSTLVGAAGFHALLSRSLALARSDSPGLAVVQLWTDGTFEWTDDSAPSGGKADLGEGGVFLIAHLLGLLVAFIGESLTLRLVREAWPRLPPKDFDLGNQASP